VKTLARFPRSAEVDTCFVQRT